MAKEPQAKHGRELKTPLLLIATPQVQDPFFHKSVVLLLHHDDEGSFGFNLNRPTTVSVAEILDGLEIQWAGDTSTHAYLGGPVQPQLGTVLYGEAGAVPGPEEPDQTTSCVLPGLAMTQHVGDLARLAKNPPDDLRLYLGYAGWGAGQLMDEILRNDWIVGPVLERLLFSTDHDAVWPQALEGAGVDPETLPSWTPDDTAAGVN
ncbi:MAG: YqgE/AlgH family protein [Thermoanaerobaculia bacterium]